MECKKCEKDEEGLKLYNSFFTKVFNVMNNYEIDNVERLRLISGHIKDTLIFHGKIYHAKYGDDALFHKHKDINNS